MGKYEAIDLDKIGNRIPCCKITTGNDKPRYDRSIPVKKNNEPCLGQYKIEEQGDRIRDKSGKNWAIDKAKKLSFIDKALAAHKHVPGPGNYPKF